MSGERVDRFGFLAREWTLDVPDVKIEPLPDISARWERIKTEVNPVVAAGTVRFHDGFLYPTLPPDHEMWKFPPDLAASHKLTLSGPYVSGPLREGTDAFIVYLLRYLFGVRLQFDDLWMDGRGAVKPGKTSSVSVASDERDTVADFLKRALETWSAWPPESRSRFTEALFVHTRLPKYHWAFERFVFEYAVTDALWKLAKLLFGLSAANHPARLQKLRERFHLYDPAADGEPPDGKMLSRIARLRRDLVHEARWDRAMLGTGGESGASEIDPDHLRRFNHRLIAAMLGYCNEYVDSNWASFSITPFRKAP